MKTPFKISFKEKIKDYNNRTILENFKVNFVGTYCDYIKIINENELIVKNDFIRWKPDLNFNLWAGIGSAKITIEENELHNDKTLKYSIDFTRLTLAYILTFLIFSMFLLFGGNFEVKDLSLLIIVIASIAVIMHIMTFLRHRSIFKQTIKFGTEYLGHYNWVEILKNKTDIELNEIIKDKWNLPKSVSNLAKTELEKRKTNIKS